MTRPARPPSQSEQLGDLPSGPGGAVRVDRAVIDSSVDLGADRLGELFGVGLAVVHAPSGAVSGQSVGDVDPLFEVVGKGEVEEWATGGGQFHGGGEPAL